MSANPIWIAGYFGPVAGAVPVWIAPGDGTVPSAVQSQIVSYYAPVAGATAVWIAGFFAPPPAAIGATPITISGWGGSGGGGHSAEALAYLARTVGGNEGGNATNIATLIDGLVSDGVWAKLDALYVLAQQNQADAKLNLIGTNYTASGSTLRIAPTFTQYAGFSFPGGSSLNLNFTPSTATSPNYTLNSASYGLWSYAVVSETVVQMGANVSSLYNDYGGNTFYGSVNNTGIVAVTTTITKGLFAVDRAGAATWYQYQNGAAGSASTSAPTSVDTTPFILAQSGSLQTLSAAFIGASLGAAGQLALYNRLRTYMSVVGVP